MRKTILCPNRNFEKNVTPPAPALRYPYVKILGRTEWLQVGSYLGRMVTYWVIFWTEDNIFVLAYFFVLA